MIKTSSSLKLHKASPNVADRSQSPFAVSDVNHEMVASDHSEEEQEEVLSDTEDELSEVSHEVVLQYETPATERISEVSISETPAATLTPTTERLSEMPISETPATTEVPTIERLSEMPISETPAATEVPAIETTATVATTQASTLHSGLNIDT
jgi:hypothetical protein